MEKRMRCKKPQKSKRKAPKPTVRAIVNLTKVVRGLVDAQRINTDKLNRILGAIEPKSVEFSFYRQDDLDYYLNRLPQQLKPVTITRDGQT